jgi:hypothetical protein
MHRYINGFGKQRVFNLFGEESFAAGLHKGSSLEMIAGGSDDFDAAIGTGALEPSGDVPRLP